MAASDDDSPWTRHLAVAVVAIAVVAVVVGAAVSVLALGAVRVVGLDDTGPRADGRPRLLIPSGVPTTTVDPYPDTGGGGETAGPGRAPRQPPRKPRKRKPALTLQASPARVAAGERITLTGAYRGHDGASLQVQRFEGSWVDFPVDTTVRAGRFSTYIITTRTGPSRLRVVDQATGKASEPARVIVG